MSTDISVQGYTVPAAIANRFDRNSKEKSPFSYSKPTPGEPTRHTRIPIPRVLNYASEEEEDSYFPPPPHSQSERAMPQVAHLQYNSPADLYSRESAQEQFVQQIGDGAIPLPAPLPEKHFDPNRSATLRYLKEGDRNGYGPSLEQQIAAVEQPREYKSPEPSWANYAREKSERARSMTPGYHRAQSEPRDTWTYEYQRESSKTPARDIDWREFQERTKTYVHDTKSGGVPYWAHTEFNQPNQTHHEYREKTPKGYECGGMDYRGNLHFDPPGPYDYVYTTKKKEEKQTRPGYAIGGTDFGKGYVSSGPYHGHGPDPPRRRTKYTADPNAPVNVALAPNIDAVDPHLLVGDTVSNMKTGKEKGSKEDGWMGLAYRNTEGFKRDHRVTARRPEQKQDNTFCTNYTRRSRSASAPRSSAPPEQRNVWRNNQENYDPYYHGAEKTVNIHTLLNDEALVPRKRETTPTWREKSLEKHYKWEHREDPAHIRPMTWTREPNWTRTVQERRGAWENRAWDTEARLALPASAKVRSEPPPAWQQNAQQKQSIWQSAANQTGTNSYTYAMPPGNQYTYQTTTTTTGPSAHQSQAAAQNYQTGYSSNYGENNANHVANTGFNKTQYDYLEERREKYGPGGHAAIGGGYQQQSTTNTYTKNTTQNQPTQNYQSYNQQQQHQEQHETRKTTTTTTNVQNEPVTRTTTYSYSQQPTSQTIPLQNGAFQTSHSSTTHTVRETSQPAAPLQTYQQQQYYQEHREKTTSEERTTQPVQQVQQQWQQQNQEQRTEQKTIREERVKPAQWWEQQQQQRKETRTTREEVTRPQQVQQQWHEQRHHRREETRTENVQPPQPIIQQQHWQQQTRREEKTTKEETQPVQPIVQQQYWQQQSRREEKTTKEETQPVQPIVQQQYWQQQSRREEKTRKEETQPVQPIVQQQYWQQQSRKEEKTTHDETRPVQPIVQQWKSQQNYQKTTENRTENKQSYPIVSSNSATKTTLPSGPPVDRKLEMSETLPLGTIANTHANTQGSYHNPEGHEISYKRDLQTTVDPGRDVALLKEEERRVVENQLEPGVISRHITTKYYKKKTVTDTTTTNQ